jgi:hypothetical protein
VHGAAGDRCARTVGPVGFGAGDVAEAIPGALADLARLRDREIEERGARQRERPAR